MDKRVLIKFLFIFLISSTGYAQVFLPPSLLPKPTPSKSVDTLPTPEPTPITKQTDSSSDNAETQPATEITATGLDSMGDRSATRPVQTIDSSLLKTDQRQNFTSGLNYLSGVQARLEGGPLISIRGSQSSSRTLVLQDGIPLNFSDGVGFNPLFIAYENLGQVSLLRGPSATLLGHDALSGALEFQSQLLKSAKFQSSYGSYNTKRVFAGAPISSKNFFGQITAFHNSTSGNFEYNVPRGSGRATRERNDSELLRSTALTQYRGEVVKVSTYHLIAREIGSTPTELGSTYQAQTFNNWATLQHATIKLDLPDQWAVKSGSSFKYLDQRYNDGSSTGRTTGFRQGFGIEKHFDQLYIEVFDDITAERLEASYLNSPNNLTQNEVGTSARIPFGEIWTIQPAVRASTDGSAVVPSFGATGIVEGGWRIFANYSEGFKAPSITQKFAQYQGFAGNPSLKPEKSQEVDVGFEKTIKDYQVRFEAFGRNTSDLIENRTVGTTSIPQNVGKARASGFDGSIEKKFGNTKWGLSSGYLDNHDVDTNSSLPLSPQMQFSFFTEHSVGKYKLALHDTYWTSYYDRTNANQLIELAGWNTLDLFITYTWSEHFAAHFSIQNIFDQPRELHLNYPEPQRSLMFTLEAQL